MLHAYVALHVDHNHIRDAIGSGKHAKTGLFLEPFEVKTTPLMTKYLSYDYKDATNGTAVNLKYNIDHFTVCAFSLLGKKIFLLHTILLT